MFGLVEIDKNQIDGRVELDEDDVAKILAYAAGHEIESETYRDKNHDFMVKVLAYFKKCGYKLPPPGEDDNGQYYHRLHFSRIAKEIMPKLKANSELWDEMVERAEAFTMPTSLKVKSVWLVKNYDKLHSEDDLKDIGEQIYPV